MTYLARSRPPLTDTVLDLRDAYHGAAEASTHAARELDELAIAVAAPSKALALARAAVSARTRREAVRTPGPMMTAAPICRVPTCRSGIAGPAPGCPGR